MSKMFYQCKKNARPTIIVLVLALLLVTLGNDFTALALTSSDYQYEIKSDGTVEIKRYSGNAKDITLPGAIDGLPVTSIGDNAFSGAGTLRSVVIPEGIEEIGNNAFFNSQRLISVTLPESLLTIGYSAFYNCRALKHILIPKNVTYIGYEAFGGNVSLMTVYFMSPTPPSIGTTVIPSPETGNGFLGTPAGARAIITNGAEANYPVNSVSGLWNNLIIYTEEQFGIDYNSPQIIIPATDINGVPRTQFYIDLSNEKLIVPIGYTIKSYSLDGGKKWKRVTRPDMFNDVNFPKLLDKGMPRLTLSDSDYNPVTKEPYDNLNVVRFAQINPRPKLAKYNVNYWIFADHTGVTAGRWTLAKPLYKDRLNEEEFRAVTTDANGDDIPLIEIGLTMGKIGTKVYADNRGFGMMQPSVVDSSGIVQKPGGIPVLTYREFGNRVTKTNYLIRTPPKTAVMAGTSGYTYTPASKPRNISISSELKPPSYSVNERKHELKIRRANIIFRGSELMLSQMLVPPTPAIYETDLTSLVFNESWHTSVAWDKAQPSSVKLSTAGFAGALTVWTRANISKPASAKQILSTPPGTPPETIPTGTPKAEVDPVIIQGTYISGGTSFLNPASQNITIKLDNDSFKAQPVGATLTSLNLPSGLTATVAFPVNDKDTSMTLTITGVPAVSSSAYIMGTIPANWLTSNAALSITANANARYSIVSASRSAVISSVVVSGSPTVPFATPYQQFTVTLTNETFSALSAGDNVSTWFTNRPGATVEAYVVNAVAAGAKSVTIEIRGTPTSTSTSNITGQIPVSAVQGSALNITSSSSARWNISGRSATFSGTNIVVGGRQNTALPATGTTNPSGEDLRITINIVNDQFVGLVAGMTDVTGWFTNIPNGMTATVDSSTTTSATIRFTGTPTVMSANDITAEIPAAYLLGDKLTVNKVSSSYIVKWRVWNVTGQSINRPINQELAVDGNDLVTPAYLTFIWYFSGGDSEKTPFTAPTINNLPAGVSLGTVPASLSAMVWTIKGKPLVVMNEPVKITIPASSLSSNRQLIIEVPEYVFTIT